MINYLFIFLKIHGIIHIIYIQLNAKTLNYNNKINIIYFIENEVDPICH
jgi:hypothetical protein